MEKCNRPTPRFNVYKADSYQLNSLLNSVEWDEALRDLDLTVPGCTFLASSIAF